MSRVFTRATAVAAVVLAMSTAAAGASGTFLQPVHVLHTFHGPTTGKGAFFGWAVSELRDVNGDGVTDAIVGEVDGGAKTRGRVWVYSGRTGHLLFRRSGRPGEQDGYAIADAGDVNGDGVSDIVSGAPGQGSDIVGHAYVYSGADGGTIVRLRGHRHGDMFGAAVSSAGDVNGDGVPDLLVGAPGTGAASGHAYVISGRTFRTIRVLSAHRRGDEFGDGVARTADLNGDGMPDLIVGASGKNPGHGAAYVYSGRTGRLIRTWPSLVVASTRGLIRLLPPSTITSPGAGLDKAPSRTKSRTPPPPLRSAPLSCSGWDGSPPEWPV